MSKRRGHSDCCCNFCAKKAWCEKNPNKGRQCCNAKQRSVDCLKLIQSRWCTLCPLFEGKTETFGPDEPALPGMDAGEAAKEALKELKKVAPELLKTSLAEAVAPVKAEVASSSAPVGEVSDPGDEEVQG